MKRQSLFMIYSIWYRHQIDFYSSKLDSCDDEQSHCKYRWVFIFQASIFVVMNSLVATIYLTQSWTIPS